MEGFNQGVTGSKWHLREITQTARWDPGEERGGALPLATRVETRLPWRPTRGSLTSPSHLVRNRTLGPPLENNPEIPPSSRDEGLRLLHGLATNLATSLQTPQEA